MAARLQEVPLRAESLERFLALLGAERVGAAAEAANRVRGRLAGRAVVNVNSTAVGGGVAELLRSLGPYVRGMGIDARWLVIEGSPEFFRITKRLHHALHGSSEGGLEFEASERRLYEQTLAASADELCERVKPGDVVILHDPQTAGLVPALVRHGATVVWRCHIGDDRPSEVADLAWQFLAPYLEEASGFVFSRRSYVPPVLDHERSVVICPSIDPFSPKNQELPDAAVHSILVHVGLVEGPPPEPMDLGFVRADGTKGTVEHSADVIRLGRAPVLETPLVVQVSRWDPLKDPIGVMQGFARLVGRGAARGAELVLAGPNVHAVADDPEADDVFNRVLAAWRALPHAVRNCVHLASLPTADVDENAAIVNALQRHSSVVVQKSLREGFGLTVTEAMWKSRAILAGAVGGIQDQIVHGEHGLLLEDPTDIDSFAALLEHLLAEPVIAARLGAAARERVREQFLPVRHLLDYVHVLDRFLF